MTDSFDQYTPIDAADAVKRATQFFQAHDDLWSMPLFLSLSDHDSTHGGVWAERCLERMLALCRTPHLDSIAQDFETLKQLRRRMAPREEFYARAQELWYRHLPARDWIETAMSRFYSGVVRDLYVCDGKSHSLGDFGGAVNMLAKGEEYPESFLSIAIEEHDLVLEQRRRGVRPCELLNLIGVEHYGFRHRHQSNA